MLLYAATIFLSAFLLFEVQPMIGKIILPWFGGSASVWNTCLLFFQASLLAGYSYAHFSTKLSEAEAASAAAHRAAGCERRSASDSAVARMEAGATRRSVGADFIIAGRNHWSAVCVCFPQPVPCCKPGMWRRGRARFRIDCSRFRISDRCWRCSVFHCWWSRWRERARRRMDGRRSSRYSCCCARLWDGRRCAPGLGLPHPVNPQGRLQLHPGATRFFGSRWRPAGPRYCFP